ncbi:MAG: hypothetical protein KJ659_09105 [Actinobacteria bacterium]|nr:hypothetical protein [Actinomycetota bacterium]MBU1607823.1 hypothetical protein [Actinomycetota bacterium]MBU2314677.1 hypothetical protein [Actinomycetota bacterium]MBU2385638.1 hypothetical protein [Actinomycetota bacterium]
MSEHAALTRFVSYCSAAGATVPEPIAHAVKLVDAAYACETPPTGFLSLDIDDVPAMITDLTIRGHAGHSEYVELGKDGLNIGVQAFARGVLAEARIAALPYLDEMVVNLRPRFDSIAQTLTTAATKYGFTFRTNSDDVVEVDDDAALNAWRALRPALAELMPIAQLRISMSTLFTVSPLLHEMNRFLGPFESARGVNYSVAFAAEDNWATDNGYYLEPVNRGADSARSIDWLELSLRGLRLNTPTEVQAKIADRYEEHLRQPAPTVSEA